MVMSGAFVFSISHVIAGIIHFGGLIIVPLSIFGFVIAFTSFVVIGALTAWVVSKWLVHADTDPTEIIYTSMVALLMA